MISYLPSPFEDELLYSVLARMGQHLRFVHQNSVSRAIFEVDYNAVIDLPGHIDKFIATLPEDTFIAQDILDKHTLLPYYAFGMPSEQYQRLVNHLRSDKGQKAHQFAGLTASSISIHPYLQYCPECIREDREKYAEAYWHRSHQVPGVLCCSKHYIWLNNSSVKTRNQRKRLAYVALEDIQVDMNNTSLDLNNSHHNSMLNIARNSQWLLLNPNYILDKDALTQRYLLLLSRSGYILGKKTVDHMRLLKDFLHFMPLETLGRLNCKLDLSLSSPWLSRLIRPKKIKSHPLHHLLLLQFMDISMDELTNLVRLDELFGKTLWQCLNPVCGYYKQPCISEQEIFLGESDYVEAHFQCPHCFFKYAQRIPEVHMSVDKPYQRVVDYGSVWKDKLLELWNDPNTSQAEASRILNVTPSTVHGNVKRIYNPKSKQVPSIRKPIPRRPNRNLSDVDRRLVDWDKQDSSLAEKIRSTAETVLSSTEKPMWMTETMLLKRVNAINVGRNRRLNPERYPQTIDILEKYIETKFQWCVRRIWWVVRNSLDNPTKLSQYNLLIESGARYTSDNPQVQQALEDAYEYYLEQVIGRDRK